MLTGNHYRQKAVAVPHTTIESARAAALKEPQVSRNHTGGQERGRLERARADVDVVVAAAAAVRASPSSTAAGTSTSAVAPLSSPASHCSNEVQASDHNHAERASCGKAVPLRRRAASDAPQMSLHDVRMDAKARRGAWRWRKGTTVWCLRFLPQKPLEEALHAVDEDADILKVLPGDGLAEQLEQDTALLDVRPRVNPAGHGSADVVQ